MSSEARPAGPDRRGRLFIVSAPSGTGKTTLVERLVSMVPGLVKSRSYTSRPAREGETDGARGEHGEQRDPHGMPPSLGGLAREVRNRERGKRAAVPVAATVILAW